MVRSKKIKDRIVDILIVLFLGIMAFACLVPILNTLAVSFSDSSSGSRDVFLLPSGFSIESYRMILEDGNYFVAFWVSVKRVFLGGFINFALTILMAYPLSKEKKTFKLRNVYMWFLVFTMLFYGGLIPWYMVIHRLKLIDTMWALVLPGAVPVFNVILLMNYIRGLPKEIEEAGIVDGARPLRMLFAIYIPISAPAIATVTLFSLVGHWNSFFDGMILINSANKVPLQTFIQRLVVRTNFTLQMSKEEIIRLNKISQMSMNAAKVIVSMVPILCVYPFLQRYFVHGIVMGSVKE